LFRYWQHCKIAHKWKTPLRLHFFCIHYQFKNDCL
jgi:hypothetical protein